MSEGSVIELHSSELTEKAQFFSALAGDCQPAQKGEISLPNRSLSAALFGDPHHLARLEIVVVRPVDGRAILGDLERIGEVVG